MGVSQAVGSNPSTRPFVMRKGISSVNDLVDGPGMMMGMGNVYRVCKTTDTAVYADLIAKQRYYADGTLMLHSTIQSALDATMENRNDYVIVQPSNSDYDITAALTLSKKAIHLLCPAGFGYERGATNACRIHQETAGLSVFTVSDAAVEIAGFYMKPYTGRTFITLASGSAAPNIHHNIFPLQTTTTNYPAIADSGNGCAWGGIEHNWFIHQGGNDQTTGSIVNILAGSTGARVNYNDFTIGDGCVATIGVYNVATKGTVNYNNFMTAGTDGSFTHCIYLGTHTTAVGNRATVADDILLDGSAPAGYSLSDNMNGSGGGLIDEI